MPKPSKKPICLACSDTGRNSKGGQCHPCLVHGRVKPDPLPVVVPPKPVPKLKPLGVDALF